MRVDEQELAIAKLYARSALELALDRGTASEMLEEVGRLEELLEAKPETPVLLTPLVETDVRRQVLERLFRHRASDLLVNTLQVMNRNGRLGLLQAFILAFRQEHDRATGWMEVAVTTAVELSDQAREKLAAVAAGHLGSRVRLVEVVDPSVIGGMVLKVGDRKFDNTVIRELGRIGQRLLERSSREVISGTAWVAAED